jgi:cell division septum initiation protein DivIVA
MARIKSVQDPSLLQAALEGLELQKRRIEEQIAQVRALLAQGRAKRGRPPVKVVAATATAEPVRRNLSPAARKRIAAAQKRRWAEYRKGTAAEAEST